MHWKVQRLSREGDLALLAEIVLLYWRCAPPRASHYTTLYLVEIFYPFQRVSE